MKTLRHVLPAFLLLVLLLPGRSTPAVPSARTDVETVAVEVADAPALPVPVPADAWEPLYDHVDAKLQAALEAALRQRRDWAPLVRNRRMAVGVVDLTNPAEPRFARVNGNQMMYAASMPKIAILLAAHVAIEEGTLEETDEVRADMAEMIRRSSNPAATRMIDRLGFDRIESVLRDPRFMLFDEKRGGGLWVGKRYAKTGARRGDPLKNLSHAATATQVCRLYYLLATGRVISVERSRRMLEDLADPGLHHKFVGEVERRAPGARLFRKSGTWRNWHSDSILVWGPHWRRYILVAMVESPNGETLLRELVPTVEALLEPREPDVAVDASASDP